ncbi:glycerophosphodiester phosphodiesterase [Nitrospira sp. M1]
MLASSTIWVGCASTAIPVSCDPPRAFSPDLPVRGISAHRGGVLGCPDNTLGAFQRAICLGVHQIELDVRATADAVLVVAHDNHMTGRDGQSVTISRATLAEVQALELGPCTGKRDCQQHIPTLEDVLAIMPTNIWINLDIKENDPLVARLVAETVAKLDRVDQVIFGVRAKAAPAVRRVEMESGTESWIGNMSRQLLRSQYIDTTIASCDEFIQLTSLRGKPSQKTVDGLKHAGIHVNYSWVKEKEEDALQEKLALLFKRGVDFVLVDHAKPAMKVVERLGYSPIVPQWKEEPPFSCSALPQCPDNP